MTPMTSGKTREYLFHNLTRILGDGGLAERDGFKAQAGQRDYAQRWAEAICRSIDNKSINREMPASLVLASADTGTGKTIGYATPLLLRAAMGVKVGISTHSHALQRQFIGTRGRPGDLQRVAGWIQELQLGSLKIRRRLGRKAFISLEAVERVYKRLFDELPASERESDDWKSLESLLEFAMTANSGSELASGLIEEAIDQLGGELPYDLTAASICLGIDASEDDEYRYNEHLIEAEEADVVIFSHAYIASCAIYRSGRLLTDSTLDSLVIDEADRLVDVAGSAFRTDLSVRRCELGLFKLPNRIGEDAGNAMKAFGDCIQEIRGGQKAIPVDSLEPLHSEKLQNCAATAAKKLTLCLKKLKQVKNTPRHTIEDLTDQVIAIEDFVRASSTAETKKTFLAAISYSPVKSLPSISVIPAAPGRILARLWNVQSDKSTPDVKWTAVNSVLFTSATLGVPGLQGIAEKRFSNIAYELGIYLNAPKDKPPIQKPEVDLWASFEPAKFGRIRYILADPSVPAPTSGVDDTKSSILNPEWVAYAAQMIANAHATSGRTLVLCASYKEVQIFSDALSEKGLAQNLITQVRGSSPKASENEFLENPRAIWLSPTSWEGLNLPGKIANLVVLRIPFKGPDEVSRAILNSLGRHTHQEVDTLLRAKMMNGAKRQLRQGFGRPIRNASDQASVWIADPRFPMHHASQIPLRYPASITYSGAYLYKALHSVIPDRFQRALENASVLLKNDELIR